MKECAFNKGYECSALNDMQCEGCAFFKTKDELVAGRLKFFARLPLLPKVQRTHIMETYYGASIRW